MNAPHLPVMAAEVVAALAPTAQGVYVDGTFGAGGYTRALRLAGAGRLVAIDRDPDAVAAGHALEAEFAGALTLIEGRFGEMDALLLARGFDAVDGVALDLGVSSMQIDQAPRGFSFRSDGPLDMRMSQSGESAADVVNGADERVLADIVFRYGEERASRRVARAIVEARKSGPILRTGQLAEIVRRAVGMRGGPTAIDPATRTFQALRIWVNDELGELERGLLAAERILRPGGRLAVVSFHSLEDRVVKTFMRDRSDAASRGSRHAPDARLGATRREERRPGWRLVTRKPTTPGEAEISANPRARSARLRVAERLAPGATP